MNLVGGYGSSSSDEDEPKKQQQQSKIELPKGKGKARALPAAAPAQASTTKQQQPTAEDTSKKKRKSSKKKKTATKKKKKSKTINALVLSLEIQAALARGETLADSDSDDEAPDKKPPKIVRRPGSDPNNLLSLLPQPSTAASADDILLKNRKKREDAKTAKSAEAAATAAAAAAATPPVPTAPATTTAPAPAGNSGGAGDQDEESDSDDGGEGLLAGMHAKSAAGLATGSDSGTTRSSPLFTLPSRARPPPGAVATALPLPEEKMETASAVPSFGDGTPAAPGYNELGAQDRSAGQQWGAIESGHPVASPHGGYGGAGYGGVGTDVSAQYATYGATSGQVWFWTASVLAQVLVCSSLNL